MEDKREIVPFVLQDIWNGVVDAPDEEREYKARDYVYASELGGSFIDRYLKMKAVPYSNPPNARSYRKFYAGDVWEELVERVMKDAGVEYTTQDRAGVEYPDLLRVSGKVDFIVKDIQALNEELVEKNKLFKTKKIIRWFNRTFLGKKPQTTIVEIKSVGSYVFEDIEAQDNPKTYHMLQAALYRKALGLPTRICYICRDDARMLEFDIDAIFPDLEKMIIEDLKQMTYYYKNDIQPEPEKLIIFENGKFKKNWKVEYSNYLSQLYSREIDMLDEDGKKVGVEMKAFERPDDYYDWVQPIVSGFNRVVKRLEEGKELTKSNQEHIAKMNSFGYDVTKLVKIK